ncbi:MAG TPA: hypothetical protein P5202_04545 [Methanomassiliicoccales archaeon]|nr:hypothetical protein [Methanomassiliicoccales archaeon]
MGPRWKWFLWRFVASIVLVAISLFLFSLAPMGDFIIWPFAIVSLVTAIVIWFYRHPDGYYGHEGSMRGSPRTEHERRVENDQAIQAERNSIGLSGYWVDRRFFGRFK